LQFSHYLAVNKENPLVVENNAEKKYHKVYHFSADGNSQSGERGARAESSELFREGPGFLAVL
jgi:hypothetical protein